MTPSIIRLASQVSSFKRSKFSLIHRQLFFFFLSKIQPVKDSSYDVKELQIVISHAGIKKRKTFFFFFLWHKRAKCDPGLLHITELCEAVVFSSSSLLYYFPSISYSYQNKYTVQSRSRIVYAWYQTLSTLCMLYTTIKVFRYMQNSDTSRAGLNVKSLLVRKWSFTPNSREMYETQQLNRKPLR